MKEFKKLVKIVSILRSKRGCPWDRKQKLKDLESYLLEETYELLEAITKNDKKMIEEELGDMFLILVFITQILKEKKKLTLYQVLKRVNKKLILRHPHVFKGKVLSKPQDVLKEWTKIKEREGKDEIKSIPKNLPSLMRAYKLIRRAQRKGVLKKRKSGLKENLCKRFKKFLDSPNSKNFNSLLFEMLLYTESSFCPENNFRRYLDRVINNLHKEQKLSY